MADPMKATCRILSRRAAGMLTAVAILLAAAALAERPAFGQTGFYIASPGELPGPPGSVIRSEPMANAPWGAASYRVLYRSTGLRGEPIAVSGVVIVPDTPYPGGTRPIIAWGHPTTGVSPRCAPSLAHFQFQQIAGLRSFIERGFLVAVTDYPGLGTPGPHPFLVGESEGRAVLDMARAARTFAGQGTARQAGHRVLLWGHSQGGQAVLFAARMARVYAPDLDIAAVAAAAPATELGQLMKDDLGTGGGDNLLAMALWSWSRVYGVSLDGVVDPAAVPSVDALAAICLESPIDILPRRAIGKDLVRRFLAAPGFIDRDPWRRLLAENTVRTLPRSLPVFLAQGTADDTVRPQVTQAYARSLCRAGSRVEFVWLPETGHGLAANRAVPTLLPWLADRLAGRPAPSTCASLR